jgi:hypothetical protein
VDIVSPASPASVRAAESATTTIPIVAGDLESDPEAVYVAVLVGVFYRVTTGMAACASVKKYISACVLRKNSHDPIARVLMAKSKRSNDGRDSFM